MSRYDEGRNALPLALLHSDAYFSPLILLAMLPSCSARFSLSEPAASSCALASAKAACLTLSAFLEASTVDFAAFSLDFAAAMWLPCSFPKFAISFSRSYVSQVRLYDWVLANFHHLAFEEH